MSFTYTPGLWNTNDLKYEEGMWSASSNDGGKITLTNVGNVDVSVTFAFEAEDLYNYFGGEFSGTGLVDNVALLPQSSQLYVTFILTGLPTGPLNDVTVGHITITITEAPAAAGGE